MQTKRFKYLVFIGRFQPFHIGHKKVIETALSVAESVLVGIGSAFQPRSIKNPWTYLDRASMVFDGLEDVDHYQFGDRVSVFPIRDYVYNDQQWVAEIQKHVDNVIRTKGEGRVGIIGHSKDESSYYLQLFPQWELVEHEMLEVVNATDLRGLYFEGKNLKFLKALVPEKVYDYLEAFKSSQHYGLLVREYNHIQTYKKQWEVSPYPPVFVTVDAIVIQSGHVLLVERDAAPGEGQMALPGGFINQNERLEDGMIRELREETKLKVPGPVLRGNIKATKVFDYPKRSLRGRTITNAFLIELPAGPLPPVKGSSDARKAEWVPLSKIDSSNMFEDHYDIIHYFLGRV
jgi:bifunctional NMN adenylyltransferase/nudix hydrolase